jgi:hypothetical protein
MKKTLIILSVVLSLSGCAEAPPMWQKAGVMPFDMENVLAKCRYDIGLSKIDREDRGENVKNCMNAQGYRYY